MSVKFTLIVRFKVQETAKAELINQLKEVFGHIVGVRTLTSQDSIEAFDEGIVRRLAW